MTLAGVVLAVDRCGFPGHAQYPQRSAGGPAQSPRIWPPGSAPGCGKPHRSCAYTDLEGRFGARSTPCAVGLSRWQSRYLQRSASADRLRPGEHVRCIQSLLPAGTNPGREDATPRRTVRITKPGIRWRSPACSVCWLTWRFLAQSSIMV